MWASAPTRVKGMRDGRPIPYEEKQRREQRPYPYGAHSGAADGGAGKCLLQDLDSQKGVNYENSTGTIFRICVL